MEQPSPPVANSLGGSFERLFRVWTNTEKLAVLLVDILVWEATAPTLRSADWAKGRQVRKFVFRAVIRLAYAAC